MPELLQLSNGLIDASFVCLLAEFLCYYVYGQHEISLEAYLMTREINHYRAVWIWIAIDVVSLVLGDDTLYELLGRVFIYFVYPLVMPLVIQAIANND